MNCIKKLPWSAGKYIDTRKYYPQDRVYCDGSVYASLAEQVGNKPYFKQDSDGTYTVAPGWALLAAGLLEDNGLGYDYEVLENLPSVNGVVLKGDKTPEELGMYSKEGADEKFETKSHAADTFQTKESAAEADKRVQGMLDGKVDKEPGKGLSANDLTDERAGKVDKLKIDGRANEYLNSAGIYSRPVRQGYGVSVADDNTVSVDPQVIARQSDVTSVAADLAAQKAKEQGDIDRTNAAISKEETDRKAAVAALQSLIDTLNPGYQFMGVATPETNPGTPDQKVFYIANGKGTYTNFGGIQVTEDEVVILYYDTAWHKVSTGIASDEKLSELVNKEDDIEQKIKQSISSEAFAFSNFKYINGNLTSATIVWFDGTNGTMTIVYNSDSTINYIRYKYGNDFYRNTFTYSADGNVASNTITKE